MKKQLNMICVLIFLVVGLSLLPSIFFVGQAFVDGFKYGMSQEKESSENKTVGRMSPIGLNLWPESFTRTAFNNKITNLKDHQDYPVMMVKAMIWIKNKDMGLMQFGGILSLISLFFIIKAIVNFYKLINTINHGVIFDWSNVRRLNRIGRFLLISFGFAQVYMLLTYLTVHRVVELEGYRFNFWLDCESMNLVIGLTALLVARIFAIGLQMKEEQDLTI